MGIICVYSAQDHRSTLENQMDIYHFTRTRSINYDKREENRSNNYKEVKYLHSDAVTFEFSRP